MGFGTVVVIIIVIVALLFIGQSIAMSKVRKKINEQIEALPDFSPSQSFIGNDVETGVAIDLERKKIALIKSSAEKIRVIEYKDVLSSEIFIDGETISKTSRQSQIGGALIGGLALGGVGAIIGGLSGKKRSSEIVKRVDLRITVNDYSNPILDINFMNTEVKKDHHIYTAAINGARHWHGLIEILIKEADAQAEQGESVESLASLDNSHSVANELSKLSELRDKGVLSDEEFTMQKQKILK